MSPLFLWITLGLYLVVAGQFFFVKKDYPMGWTFLCYALANLGFIWHAGK